MRINQHKRMLLVVIVIIGMLVATATAWAATEPTKFLPSSRFGFKVNEFTGGNTCTISPEDNCKNGEESEQAGGFAFPEGVAVAPNGNVYVSDNVNHRIQEFTKRDELVLMFGWHVNRTKVKASGSEAEDNLCTASEVAKGAECLAGEAGNGDAGGMLGVVKDLSVDQTTGDVYALDGQYHRVDEFSDTGEFVLMVGGDVNRTKVKAGGTEAEENVCTATEVAKGTECQGGMESAEGSRAHGAFKTEKNIFGFGNLLANGGPNDLLYVGDEARVQEFDKTDGAWVGEISLSTLSNTANITAIAVDSVGQVFVVDKGVKGVHEYNEKAELQATVIEPNSENITALALDAFGRLGLIEYKEAELSFEYHGLLYRTSGEEVGEFASLSGMIPGINPKVLAFDLSTSSDELYVAEPATQAIEVYMPFVFPTILTCDGQVVEGTSASLCGEINPQGISANGFFGYGIPGVQQSFTTVAFQGEGSALVPYEQQVTELVPNQTYQFEAVVEAMAEGLEQRENGNVLEFHTTTPVPEIPDEPVASYVTSQSALLNALVNPEHAATHYHFEYGACPTLAKCTLSEAVDIRATPDEEYSGYGLTGATQEIRGLSTQTTYSYRLVADNAFEEERLESGKPQLVTEGGETTGAESTFTTRSMPLPQADTGSYTALTATSAIVSGTVYAEGQSATYTFELGIYQSAATQYGVVFSGPISVGAGVFEASLALTGLQPGITYAYRIDVSNGDIENPSHTVQGLPAMFTTLGLPAVLTMPAILPQLPVPQIKFPTSSTPIKAKVVRKKAVKTKKKPLKKHKAKAGRRDRRTGGER